MEIKLPQTERVVTETINGKQIEKKLYADGSYGVESNGGRFVERYFPDGKKQIYSLNDEGSIHSMREILPDGCMTSYDAKGNVTYRKSWTGEERGYEWYENGQKKSEIVVDGDDRYECKWYENGQKKYESLPNGEKREWYENGQIKLECYRGFMLSLETRYNENGDVTYHATDGREDTAVYFAKKRVEKQKEERLAKLANKPKVVQKVATKIASTELFNNIAVKVATNRIKKGKGE